jgi:pyruvate formate lyase activating enzyme
MGMIANIQRCSVHDGPGIRTSVFLKGCNLKCAWCHNPETISFAPTEMFHPERCIHCGMCEEGCFSGARTICGTEMTVEQVVREAMLDRDYYGSEGGVTVTGGEPTCQADFTADLLRALRALGVHTAIESNLCCAPAVLEKVTAHADLIMADLKIFDSERHRQYTGAGNEQIKANLRSVRKPIIVRTPVIRGINDTLEEIGQIAELAGQIPTLMYYELLPYHPLGLSKGVGSQERMEAPSAEDMKALAYEAKKYCAQVRIAGRIVE